MRALRECREVKPALVGASIQGRREGHEGRLHVVQGALDETVVILNNGHARGVSIVRHTRDTAVVQYAPSCLLATTGLFSGCAAQLGLKTVNKYARYHDSTSSKQQLRPNGGLRKGARLPALANRDACLRRGGDD